MTDRHGTAARIWFRTAVRFGIVGLFVTGVHIFVVMAVMHLLVPNQVAANAAGFVIATLVSYTANTIWSFSERLRGETLARFVVVSLIGLSLTMAVSGTAEYLRLSYWYGIMLVLLVVPPTTFLLHSSWTYRSGDARKATSWSE